MLFVAGLPRRGSSASQNDVVEFRLTSAPLRFSPVNGVAFAGLGYNGTIPGPVLRVMHGQRVRVRYTSNADVATTIHWHGMILPNDMDGVAGVTQPAVSPGSEFVYEFAPSPPGTRWYHDHALQLAAMRGLFGMFIVEDPADEPNDAEFALVFHDVPDWNSVESARRGVSTAAMAAPSGSPEMMRMKATHAKMGDEVEYVAHCINGASYPNGKKLRVSVGDRVRLRILNASFTQTRYVRLAGHRLIVTHSDGNRISHPFEVDVLRVGVAERYDVQFEVRKPGAFLLQGLTGDAFAEQQAALFYTEGMENAPPLRDPQKLDGLRVFSYALAGGETAQGPLLRGPIYNLTLGGGGWANAKWTINGAIWPHTPKLRVRRGDLVTVRFLNKTDMDHPMHLHGHRFGLIEVGGTYLARPLAKDVSLVPANGGTTTWQFFADSPAGRWLLHCHNEIHMLGGMMTEVVYA
jgi:FtsP/CotA-like multicopper oxidase with cupredoxin domain